MHSQPEHKLPYVAIRGSVKALGTPITSVNNENITGTIQKLSLKEHVVARGSAGYWFVLIVVITLIKFIKKAICICRFKYLL